VPAADPQSLLAEALLAHLERRYQQAEELYRQVLHQDPGMISAHVRYAILLVGLGRPDEAEARLAEAINVDPELTQSRLEAAHRQDQHDDEIQSLLGLFSLHCGSPLLAQSQLHAALRANPDNVAAQAWMRQALIATEQESQAGPTGIAAYEEPDTPGAGPPRNQEAPLPAERQDPRAGQATLAATGALSDDRTLDEVERAAGAPVPQPEPGEAADVPASIGVSRDMERFRDHLVEAERLEAARNYNEAISELRAAAKLLPDDEQVRVRIQEIEDKNRIAQLVSAREQQAQERAKDRDYPGALQLLEVALQLDPENADLLANHRQLLDQSKAFDITARARNLARSDPQQALQLLERALELAPQLEDVTTLQAEIEHRLARHEEVQAALQRARDLRSSGSLAEAQRTLSDALQVHPGEGQLKEVMAELDQAIVAHIEQCLRDGHGARDAGDLDQAMALFEKAIDLSPGHEGAQQALTSLVQQLQATAKALDKWHEAQTHHAAGDLSGAMAALKQAVSLSPDDQEMQDALQLWEREQLEQERQRRHAAEEARRLQQELAEQRRREAEAKQQQELAEQRRRDAEAKQQQELAEQRRREAEAKQQQELAEQRRREAEAEPRKEGRPATEQAIPQVPAAAVRHYAAQAIANWNIEDTSRSSAALWKAYRLEGQSGSSKQIALQCGLVWASLLWTSSLELSAADRKAVRTVVRQIESRDQALRSDFVSHLLAHLARAAVDGERYHLENLALPGNTPDPMDRKIVQMVIRYRHLDAESRQQMDGMLVDRAKGEMGDLVLHAIRQLLRRRA
jgi:tetratricopeptide (TPR) repeat protein